MPPSDIELARLAARQDGAISRNQLLGLGFTRHEIGSRVARGWLTPVYRGVYAVGPLSDRGRVRAAILAAGPYAAASHTTAAWLRALISTLPAVLAAGFLPAATGGVGPDCRSTTTDSNPARSRAQRHPVTTSCEPWKTWAGRNGSSPRRSRGTSCVRSSSPSREQPDGQRLRGPDARPRPRAGLPQPVAQYRLGPHARLRWPDRSGVETDGGPPTAAAQRSRTTAPATPRCWPRVAGAAHDVPAAAAGAAAVAAQLAAVLAQARQRLEQLRVRLVGGLGHRLVGDPAADDVDALGQPRVLARGALDARVGDVEDVGQRRVGQRVGEVIGTAPGMLATQ